MALFVLFLWDLYSFQCSVFPVFIACFFSTSLSMINSLIWDESHGESLFLTLRVFIGAWLFAIERKTSFHFPHSSLGLFVFVKMASHGTFLSSLLNFSALKFLNCLDVKYFGLFFEGIENLRTAYIKLWSLIPICMTPDVTILDGMFVIITSIRVLLVSVMRVGWFINCCSWYISQMEFSCFVLWSGLSVCKLQFRSPINMISLSSESAVSIILVSSSKKVSSALGGLYAAVTIKGLFWVLLSRLI